MESRGPEPVVFGRYLLLDRIAAGGMAEVYRAKSYGVAGFEKLLVIKKILPHLSKNKRFVSMFIKEAKIAVTLSHKSIIQVFDLGKVGEDYYIAMEFLHGKDLRRITRACAKKRIPVPLPLAVYVFAEVLGSLDYAHRRKDRKGKALNIIHMDVSPQNVMVSFEGDVKLGDFGIAHAVGGDGKIRGGTLRGKYAYMSPEMASGKSVDQRTDLFSAGIILYELITGRRLFWKPDELKTIENVRRCRVAPPSEINPAVPPFLDRIALKALAKDPNKRYQAAEEMRADLTAALFKFEQVFDATSLSRFMGHVFEEEAAAMPGSADLSNLITDVEKLRKVQKASPVQLQKNEEAKAKEISEVSLSEATPIREDQILPPLEEPKDGPSLPTADSRSQSGSASMVASVGDEDSGTAEWTVSGPSEPQELTISGERKRVVILTTRFDLDGVHASESKDVVDMMTQAVKQLEGTIGVQSGGSTTYFGVPVAHEDDLGRAIYVARETLKRVKRLQSRGSKISVGLALHVGTVAIEGSGDSIEREGDWFPVVTGDPVVLAQRLGASAPTGKVIASRAVARFAGNNYDFVRIDPDSDPDLGLVLERYELVDTGNRRVTQESQRGPLVGRDRELEIIRNLLSKVHEGRGQVLALKGDAGVGKTRIVFELGMLAADKQVGWYRGRATPYGVEAESGALFPQLVRQVCGMTSEDSLDQRHEKLERLSQLGLEEGEIHLIGNLIGVRRESRTDLGLDSERYRQGLIDAIKKMLEQLSRERPLILVFEDLQHVNAMNESMLSQLLDVVTERRILLIMTYRPEFRHSWWSNPYYNQIALEPLEEKDSVDLLKKAFGARNIPKKLRDVVLDTAGGNPLFLEELADALTRDEKVKVEDGRLWVVGDIHSLEVPATLRATVTARLDRLLPEAKRALQVGSVLGRRFPYRNLLEIMGQVPGLDGVLVELQRENFLFEVAEGDELLYEFRHPMVREVSYDSLPNDARRKLHVLAAETIQRLNEGSAEEPVEILAYHFEKGEDPHRAMHYLEKMGDQCATAHRCAAALRAYEGARDISRELTGTKQVRKLTLSLLLKIGKMAMREEQHDAAGSSFKDALRLSQELSDVCQRGWAHKELGNLYRLRGDFTRASNSLDEALHCAEQSKDDRLLFEVLEAQGNLQVSRGSGDEAEKILARALEMARKLEEPEATARAMNDLAVFFDREGRHEEAEDYLLKAVEQVEVGEDKFLAARVLNNAGAVFAGRRDVQRARPYFEESLELNRTIGYRRGVVVNLHNLGELHWREGDSGRAQYYFAESEALAGEIGWRPGVIVNQMFLGYFRVRDGKNPEGLVELEKALEEANSIEHGEGMAIGRFLLSRLFSDEGKGSEASAIEAEAMELAQKIGLRELVEDIRLGHA